MLKIGFLPGYIGIAVHDFWMSYFKATKAEHAVCGAHLLRELTGIYENHPEQTWARDLYQELMSISFIMCSLMRANIMTAMKIIHLKACLIY